MVVSVATESVIIIIRSVVYTFVVIKYYKRVFSFHSLKSLTHTEPGITTVITT